MRGHIRTLLTLIACVLTLGATAAPAAAKWPSEKPMTFIVSWPAGASVDILARLLAENLSKKLGNQILVENRPGASGNIGQNAAAKATPDGYTFILSTPGPAANNVLTFKSLPYDPATDFTNITLLVEDSLALIVGPRLKINDMKEFVAYAKANPGKLQFAHPGAGSYAHIAQLALQDLVGAEFNLVPYRGTPQMATDLLGAQIDAAMNFSAGFVPHVEAGKLKAIATVAEKRSAKLPNTPTFKEVGIDFSASPWIALQGPKGISRDIVERMNKAVREVMAEKEVVEKLAATNTSVRTTTPEELDAIIKAELDKWRPVITKYKITAE